MYMTSHCLCGFLYVIILAGLKGVYVQKLWEELGRYGQDNCIGMIGKYVSGFTML
jgi:hypothetical protein